MTTHAAPDLRREDAIGTPPQRPTLVPAQRYYSAAFAQLEVERMWPKVWQLACTVDHIAGPGDYFEYRCGPYSVLIVRGDDGTLRAFQNVCRHRGNSLCAGAGSNLRELRCGYHGWTWDLAGSLKRVPNRKGFGALPMAELPLFAVRVDTWERLVFVNLDSGAPPLADYLEAVPDDIAWLGLGDFRCYATMTVEVDANWKTIADGFSETYHIQTLHPELHRCMDDVYAPQVIWGHTGKSEQIYGVPSPHLKQPLSDADVWDAYVRTQGALMGVADGTPFPGRPMSARTVGRGGNRRADTSFRCRARCRFELGQYRSGDAATPVQHLSQHDIAGQRRSPHRDDLPSRARSRPRRAGDDVVDAYAARRCAVPARRCSDDRRRS